MLLLRYVAYTIIYWGTLIAQCEKKGGWREEGIGTTSNQQLLMKSTKLLKSCCAG